MVSLRNCSAYIPDAELQVGADVRAGLLIVRAQGRAGLIREWPSSSTRACSLNSLSYLHRSAPCILIARARCVPLTPVP